jgi:uncharacterized repeat protein (TIGR01451 family)
VISNGVVQLGVNASGELNYDCTSAGDTSCPPETEETDVVGLRFAPLNLESTAPGCLCEGWGAADAGSGLTGHANQDFGAPVNITVDNFTATATQAVSTVTIADPAIPGFQMQVTQDYHPSLLSSNLYVNTVSITNTGANPITDLRYRRAMDWDIEPTAFEEWVTNQGSAPQLLFSSDDGFADSDPLAGPSYIDSEAVCGPDYTGPCEFVDLGSGGTYPTVTSPDDHGGLFDFGFGALAVGETKTFTVYYGAAPSETDAINALNTGGAQVYSLGEPDCSGETVADCDSGTGRAGVEQGKPATFMFAFVTSSSDLKIKKKAPKTGTKGKSLKYKITVTNDGPDEARGVQVIDELPKSVKFVKATSGKGTCTLDTDPYKPGPGTVVCDIGSIDNGGQVVIKITVKAKKQGKVKNTASVLSVSEDKVASNNSDSDSTKVGGLKHCHITIDGDDLKGTNGNNTLKGTKKSDRLRGLGGNDKLNGKKDADCILGAEGNDKIVGDDGDDVIRAGGDNDTVSAGDGDDNVRAQNGEDKINGGAGNDFLKAQAKGSDVVKCGPGNDRVIGDEKDKIAGDCEKVKIVNPN